MDARMTVFDVAAFIVARTGAIQPMKLQKLVYYAQAWSLVRDGEPLFEQRIEAWRYGPVCPDLYFAHRGLELVPVPYPHGDPSKVDPKPAQTIHLVLRAYGEKSSRWLSDLTHREDPWKNARLGLPIDARSNEEITMEAMRVYYETTDSTEKRVMMGSDRGNPIIASIEDMSDDDATVIDELTVLDEDPEVAKLSV